MKICNIFTSLCHIFSCLDMGCPPSNLPQKVQSYQRFLVLKFLCWLCQKTPKQQLQKKHKNKNTNKHHQTNKQTTLPSVFPVLELLSELSSKFKISKFLFFSSTSGNIHPVTKVWTHLIICSPWFLQGSVVRTWSRAHCAKHSFLRCFSL